jgi:hypothetical protein
MAKRKVLPAFSLLCFVTLVISLPSLSGTGWAAQRQSISNAVVHYPEQSDVSLPLRELLLTPYVAPSTQTIIPIRPAKSLPALVQGAGVAGAAAASIPGPAIRATVGLNFEGVGNGAHNNCPSVAGITVAPPDTNAAVGDTQVVQWVNLCYAVFDKASGALLAGPFAGNRFWSGFNGNVCGFRNDGDIIIQWDKANHVWVAAQNVFNPWLTCVAVSTSADATGSYNRYAFTQPGFPDYPKWGLTSSIYYQTQNDFGPSGSGFVGVNVCAYDAVAMRAGKKNAKQVCILDNSNGTLFDDSMLPADTDAGSGGGGSEVLVGSIDNFNPGSNVYEYIFTVNMKKGTATLDGVNGSMPIAVPTYSLAICPIVFPADRPTDCVKQPSPGSDLLDTLGDRLMYRLALFDDGTTQHFVVTHSVNNTTAVAARWYEFRAPEGSTALSFYQSGQTPDDGEYRWMGSAAYDKFGDIALGYSRSSAAPGDYPSIYLSGQTAGEALGTTDAESLVWQGSGSQSFTDNRWGDYSSMAVDSADSCSFWYTTEYYPADGSFAWQTRLIGQIRFPSCP